MRNKQSFHLSAVEVSALNAAPDQRRLEVLAQALVVKRSDTCCIVTPYVDYDDADGMISGMTILTSENSAIEASQDLVMRMLKNAGFVGHSWVWGSLLGNADLLVSPAQASSEPESGFVKVSQSKGFLRISGSPLASYFGRYAQD